MWWQLLVLISMKTNKPSYLFLALGLLICAYILVLGIPLFVTASAPVVGAVGAYTIDENHAEYSHPDKQALLQAIEQTRAAVMDSTGAFDRAAIGSVHVGEHVYDNRSIDHLRDVKSVISRATVATGFALIGILVFATILIRSGQRRLVQRVLGIVGGSYLVATIGFGLWAFIDFNSLFTQFHHVFFAEGTWLFSHDSLLIVLFPEKFWMISGAIWLLLVLLSSIGLVAYSVLSRPKTVV